MRRICCFCERWESGGIESFLNNMIGHMELSGLEIDIVAACIQNSVFTAELEEKGVHFIELSGKLRNPKNYQIFRELLREKRYDVVHFNLFQGMALRYIHIAEQENIPVRIAHSHNTALRKSMGRTAKFVLHRIGRNLYGQSPTEHWACSKAAAEFLFAPRALKRKPYRFIPNGIETERFRFDPEVREKVRAELGISDCFVIGNVGRLCYQKNQDFLLDVFAQVLKLRPESRLLLVGEGDTKEHLQEKSRRLGIAEKVIFYGVTNQVQQLFWAMDVFAFPSLFEGLGIVAVEAQAAGLPVFCSEHIPPEAKITNETYTLPMDAEAWAKALAKTTSVRKDDALIAIQIAGFGVGDVVTAIQSVYSGEKE